VQLIVTNWVKITSNAYLSTIQFKSQFYQFLCLNFRLEDMKDQLRKRMFTKRIVKRLKFTIVNGISIELNSYALIRPTAPGRNLTSLF